MNALPRRQTDASRGGHRQTWSIRIAGESIIIGWLRKHLTIWPDLSFKSFKLCGIFAIRLCLPKVNGYRSAGQANESIDGRGLYNK